MSPRMKLRSVCNGTGSAIKSPARLYRPLPSELSYLSWGHRRYGDTPVAAAMHEGWHYFLVLHGSPRLVFEDTAIQAPRGTLCLSHPDCVIGHDDQKGAGCEMLTWIWRTAPTHSALRPLAGEHLLLQLTEAQIRLLRRLHAQSREAVAGSNERSTLQLSSARLQLDLSLLEAFEPESGADGNFRVELAIGYLRNHMSERPSLKSLCDYLQVSEASLKRLFHQHTGKSPRDFVQEWRMAWARDHLLPNEGSVKSAAYALGYRHPADFSRAYKAHFGRLASEACKAPTRTAAR